MANWGVYAPMVLELLYFLSNFLIFPTLIVLILFLPGLYLVVETPKLVEWSEIHPLLKT